MTQIQLEQTALTPPVIQVLLQLSQKWADENSCHGYVCNTPAELEGRTVFLARHDQRVVGYLFGVFEKTARDSSIIAKNSSVFEIEELFVLPDFRGQGIGGALFERCEQTVRAQAQYITLSTATKNWKGILHFYLDELDMTFWSARLFKKLS